MRPLLWLEDFNDRPPDPSPVEQQAEDVMEPGPEPEVLPDPCAEAWSDGFLAGSRLNQQNTREPVQGFAADLGQRLAEIEEKLEAIANNAAVTMAGLLVDMLAAALPDDWPAAVADRLHGITEAIRPVFSLAPMLEVHTDPPGEIAYQDLPGFYKILEASQASDWPLGIRWQVQTTPEQITDKLKAAIAGSE